MPDSLAPRDGEVDNTEGSSGLYDWGDNVDTSTFEQILEMDDDEEEREFSRSIVVGFFEQAEATFVQIDEALGARDLPSLSSLGHFLKGSSATLGLTKVKNSCEKIQHFGQKKDQEGIADEEDEEVCLKRIEETFQTLKKDYVEAVHILKTFFGMSTQDESTNEGESHPKTIIPLPTTGNEAEWTTTTTLLSSPESDAKTVAFSDPTNQADASSSNVVQVSIAKEVDNLKICLTTLDSPEKDTSLNGATAAIKNSISRRRDQDVSSKNRAINNDIISDTTKTSAVLGAAMMTTAKLTSVS